MNWALAGLERLGRQGKFTRPPHVEETIRTLQDLASPVAAFVRDRCEVAADKQVTVDDLYGAWRGWAEENGHAKSNKTVFGRDLRAVLAGRLRMVRPRVGEERQRVYEGIGLR